MAFLGKGKKSDLTSLNLEIGEEVTSELQITDLKELITKSKNYEQDLVICLTILLRNR